MALLPFKSKSENRAERAKITSHPQNTTKSKQTSGNTVKAGQDKSKAPNNTPRAAKMMKRLVNNGRSSSLPTTEGIARRTSHCHAHRVVDNPLSISVVMYFPKLWTQEAKEKR